MITIDKGIPLPPKGKPGRPARTSPFAKMEIGDSMFFNGADISQSGKWSGAQRRYGIRLTARTVEGGVRVWRIA
ncbi:MAG TPA: hypothetical protein VN903_25610 [Polyangia bacterium]|nr:hypothetical protein [Polyangia bacterium]